MQIKKLLVIGNIFLFIGVAVTSSITTSVVTASQDDDLVGITTQICGIKGYRETTVELTREQCQNLEQYLIEFRAGLNQTATKDEAVPLFKEAVVELDKYGLLPKGMSVALAQHLILRGYQHPRFYTIFDMIPDLYEENTDDFENSFCMVTGQTTDTISRGPILTLVSISANHIYGYLQDWLSKHYNRFTIFLDTVVYLILLPFIISLEIADSLSNLCPIMFLSTVGLGCWSPMGPGGIAIPWVYPARGWLYTNGLNGVKNWSGNLLGNSSSNDDRICLGIYEFYPGILGFSGIKITLPFVNSFYLGYAYKVRIELEETI